MINSVLRFWHTVRWLKPVQVYGRLWFRFYRPRPDLRPAPVMREHFGVWVLCARAASMTGPRGFRLLGVERTLFEADDWNRADWSKLWLYNAHYFDDLAATDAHARLAWHADLMERWILENPPAQGNGWEPYPTSLRMVNWVKWALTGNILSGVAHQSLAVQARYLLDRLEVHLLGNHLWANAKALVFAGLFFDGVEAAGWRDKGLALLQRELEEQVLPDGGHFERSPMYHSIILEDLLDLVQLASRHPGVIGEVQVSQWRETSARMLRWLRVMSHPDGGIAFFNDAALGVAPDIAALARYAVALGLETMQSPLAEIEALPESGYVRMQCGPSVLIADVAEIGPDYLPGHAHADSLSFELSLHGQRVLVNGGTSTYDAGQARTNERGTTMHNTVQVDGLDSSETWGSFRVARRARPLGVRWGSDGDNLWLEAGHDGYLRLPGRVIHRRRWLLKSDCLQVTDGLEGIFGTAVARFRFAPGQTVQWLTSGQDRQAVIPSNWHPCFGKTEACELLEIAFTGTTLKTEFNWS